MPTSELLRLHGTEKHTLKPGAVVQAARLDLRKRELNSEEGLGIERYAFHRKHVRKAKDAADLIRIALADIEPGLESGKLNTRMLYSQPDLLEDALKLAAGQKEAAVEEA